MSDGEAPVRLRPKLLPQRQRPYTPKFSRGNPEALYHPNFSSRLDVMTSVSSRLPTNSASPRHRASQEDGKLYGIRKYPVQIVGESTHPIEDLMKLCLAREVTQCRMQHLLMPVHALLHVHDRSFYTVSEHMSVTISDVLLGVKRWPEMLCHDEIWSIVQQVLVDPSSCPRMLPSAFDISLTLDRF